MNVVIARGIKCIRESKMGTPSSEGMIQYVDMVFKLLEIVYCTNGAAVEEISERNWYRQKVVGEGKFVSWGGAWTKGEVREWKLTKNIFLHSDLLNFCLERNTTSLSSSLTQRCLTIIKIALRSNGAKRYRSINQSNHNMHKFDLRQNLQKILEHFCVDFKFWRFWLTDQSY